MRQKTLLPFAAILFLWPGAGLAAQDGWLYFRGDSAYDWAYSRSIAEGEAPALSFPWFGDEPWIAAYAAADALTRNGIDLSTATPTFAYSTPYSDNTEISSGMPSATTAPSAPELLAAVALLPSPLEASLSFSSKAGFSARVEAGLLYRRDYFFGAGSALSWGLGNWTTNLLGNLELPRRTWVAKRSGSLGFAAGRFPSGIGSGHFGSTVQNPRASYYDQLRAQYDDRNLRITWMLGSSSAQLTAQEAKIQWNYNEDGSSYWDSGDNQSDHDYSSSRDAVKLFAYHTLEWSPFANLRMAVTEMGVMGGTTPSLNFLLPTVLWHDTYSAGYSNVGMAMLASYVPVKGLQIGGEYFLDDFRAAGESSVSKPTAGAWQVSTRYDSVERNKTAFSCGAEFTHVDRWTYVRWQPYLSMYQRQILPGGYRGIDIPLGFDYGPDVDHVGAWLELRASRDVTAKLSYEFVRKGPIRMGMINTIGSDNIPVYYDYDTYAGSGALQEILSMPDEHRHIVTISGSFALNKHLEARLSGTMAFFDNYGNVADIQKTLWMVYVGLIWKLRETALP